MGDFSTNHPTGVTPLAIVGMAFEFPDDAVSAEGFWNMLQAGRSASKEFPPDRIHIDAYYHPDGTRPSSVRFCYPNQNGEQQREWETC